MRLGDPGPPGAGVVPPPPPFLSSSLSLPPPLTPSSAPSSAACRLNTSIPHPSCCSHNITSASMYPTDLRGRKRKLKVCSHLTHLGGVSDILCLQETQLRERDFDSLGWVLKTHKIYYSNADEGTKGGIATAVSKRYASGFDIEQIELGPGSRGRVLALKFTSRLFPLDPRASFYAVNVYLQSGGSNGPRLDQLEVISALSTDIPMFLLGDFNMVEASLDAPGPKSGIILDGADREKWDGMLLNFCLQEVWQDSHTHYFRAQEPENCRSSKIDRVYCSLRAEELAVVSPMAELLLPKALSSGMYESLPTRSPLATKPLSSHLPVLVRFFGTAPSKNRDYNVPSWVPRTEGFAAAVKAKWRRDRDPFIDLSNWKRAAVGACKAFFKNLKRKKAKLKGELGLFAGLVAFVRAASRRNPDLDHVHSLLATYDNLGELVDRNSDGSFSWARASGKIRDLTQSDFRLAAEDTLDFADVPGTFLPGDDCAADPISRLKTRLPGDRQRMVGLRSSPGMELRTDTKGMCDIITGYYGKLWTKDVGLANEEEIGDYVAAHVSVIPNHLRPPTPSKDDFIDAINCTNDSCPGPDGIPFSAYREFLKEDPSIAEVLCAVAGAMGNGVLPPRPYNEARLFLIPKKQGGLVADTRCISVTDSSNRVHASVLAKLITPAMQHAINRDQLGFVPGRVGTQHIHDLLSGFYSKLDKKQQSYVLLLDFKRAFDSVSHQFILATIKGLGLPGWFRRSVRGLLHEVWVNPVLPEKCSVKIPILRGVKQGCPLSPLLFVMCLDALLNRMDNVPGIRKHAYADDIAVTSDVFSMLCPLFPILGEFGRISGLVINITKSQMVSTFVCSSRVKERAQSEGWKDLEFASRGVYLGILFGSLVTTEEVCREVWDKFFARAGRYRGVLDSSSILDRVLIANTFLLPLWYYVASFIVLPYPMVEQVRRFLHTSVVPFFGGGFGYAHLITPHGPGELSLARPLKDLWSFNYALLAWSFPLEDSELSPTPCLGSFARVSGWNFLDNSLSPADHAAYAAFYFLEDSAPRRNGVLISLEGLPNTGHARARRGWIYLNLTLRSPDYKTQRWSYSKVTSLPWKVGKAIGGTTHPFPDRGAAKRMCANGNLARTKVSAGKWDIMFRAVTNSLPFSKRMFQAGMIREVVPCYFCGALESDSHHHVFGDCPVVCEARGLVGLATGAELGTGLDHAFLTVGLLPQNVAIVGCCFLAAVWRVRTHFLAFCPTLISRTKVLGRLIDSTIGSLPLPGASRRGEAASRCLAITPPASAIAGYSDGSSLGNPGPTGAGFVVKQGGVTLHSCSIPLGQADNSVGETEAFGALARFIHAGVVEGSLQGDEAFLFSDCSGVVGYLCRGWAPPTNKVLSRKTRNSVEDLKGVIKVGIYWVRGHAGVPGNDEADVKAKEGAAASALRIDRSRLPGGRSRRATSRADRSPNPQTTLSQHATHPPTTSSPTYADHNHHISQLSSNQHPSQLHPP